MISEPVVGIIMLFVMILAIFIDNHLEGSSIEHYNRVA